MSSSSFDVTLEPGPESTRARSTSLAITDKLGIRSADEEIDGDGSMAPVEVTDQLLGGDVRLALSSQRQRAASKRYNIAGDKVFPATENLPAEQRDAIRWLHQYGVTENLAPEDLGLLLRRPDGSFYDGNTVYRALTGRTNPNASLDNITTAITQLRSKLAEQGELHKAKFIETRLTRRLFKIFDAARLYQKVIFCYSDSQVGKTTTAEEYQRTHNHGQTIYVRCPQGANLRSILQEIILQASLNIDIHASNNELRRRISRCFSRTMLLIFDEVHQTVLRRFQLETLEFIRELHDRCKCGIVLIGTNIFEDELQRGKHKLLLGQLKRRSLAAIKLPAAPGKKELDAFAAEYGLPPAEGEALELQSSVIKDPERGGLGVWCTYLQAGSHVAAKTKKKMTWEHVLRAHTGLKALEQMKDLD